MAEVLAREEVCGRDVVGVRTIRHAIVVCDEGLEGVCGGLRGRGGMSARGKQGAVTKEVEFAWCRWGTGVLLVSCVACQRGCVDADEEDEGALEEWLEHGARGYVLRDEVVPPVSRDMVK